MEEEAENIEKQHRDVGIMLFKESFVKRENNTYMYDMKKRSSFFFSSFLLLFFVKLFKKKGENLSWKVII